MPGTRSNTGKTSISLGHDPQNEGTPPEERGGHRGHLGWLPESRQSQPGEVTCPAHTCCRQSGSSEPTPASQVHTPVPCAPGDAAATREVASSVGRRGSSPEREDGSFLLGVLWELRDLSGGESCVQARAVGASEVPGLGRPGPRERDHPLPCRFSPPAGSRALTFSSVRAQGLAPCPAHSPCWEPNRAGWTTVRAARNTSVSPGSGQ